MTLGFQKKTQLSNINSPLKENIQTKKKHHKQQEKEPKRQSSSNTIVTANNQDSYLNGIGPYEFMKPLGSGKFSRVMLAYHLETHQQVAIKVLHDLLLMKGTPFLNPTFYRLSINRHMTTESCLD